MSWTNTYVDPAIAASSGTGTIGDPYGDVQYALDTMTRDSSNGDRINIKAGTDEVLTASLDLTSYGTPGINTSLIFQGYTSAAQDGGMGAISGAGSFSIFNSTSIDGVHFIDMELHNSGSSDIVRTDNNSYFLRCYVHNTSGDGIRTDLAGLVQGCYITDVGGIGIYGNGVIAQYNFLKNGAKSFSTALGGGNGYFFRNILSLSGASDGIVNSAGGTIADGNTVWSNGGTGTGLLINNTREFPSVSNNIFAGFSGAGGKGVEHTSALGEIGYYGNNAFYDNATDEDISGRILIDAGNSTLLGSDPFSDAANDDFSVTTALKALGYPSTFTNSSTSNYLDIGAAQREEPAGGGSAQTSNGHFS